MVHGSRANVAEVGGSTAPYGRLAGKFLKFCKLLVEEGDHPSLITKSLWPATQVVLENIKELSAYVAEENKKELQDRLAGYARAGSSSESNHQLDTSSHKWW